MKLKENQCILKNFKVFIEGCKWKFKVHIIIYVNTVHSAYLYIMLICGRVLQCTGK